jgi:ATP-dependent DNA helicase DinG
MKARREAMAADLVVVNHHLFFADMALRDSGVAELLPSVECAVFDEAHQLVEPACSSSARTLGTAQVIDFARDLLGRGLQQARGLRRGRSCAGAATRRARAAPGLRGRAARRARHAQAALGRARGARRSSALRLRGRAAAAEALRRSARLAPDFASSPSARAAGRARARFARRPRRPRALDRPVAAAGAAGRVAAGHPRALREQMAARRRPGSSRRRRSATTTAELVHRAGRLEDARTLRVGSPFDYARTRALYVPRGFPKPNEPAIRGGRPLAARCAARSAAAPSC